MVCDLRIIGPVAVDADVTMEDIKKEEVGIKKDMGKHQMDVVEAKFHEWMEKVGREYPNEEEKAYRFELFKERLKETETFTEEGRGKNSFPCFADMTDDEIRAITNCHKPRSKEYEASLMRVNILFLLSENYYLHNDCPSSGKHAHYTDNNKPPRRHSNQHHKNYILSLVDVDCTCSNRVDPNCLKYLYY